ncbi:MAG TPA: prolyl oligopeptidase family serine peptidase [Chlamydiales bacterium]|nr:prolyl oligopeptidase family serine peptidase [Chlamydiales bacterium]
MRNKIASLAVTSDLPLFHVGPALDHGPLPSFFYFALSGPDSLCLDPFNQPVQFIQGKMIRIFSLTLPGHEAELPAENAMNLWAEDFQKETDWIEKFLHSVSLAVEFAIRERFVDPEKMGIGGLSRGGFIAAHAAARDSRFKYLLGFSPLTSLSLLKEFSFLKTHPAVANLDTKILSASLAKRHCRFYIGNRDTRVGTRACFDFAMSIVEAAHEQKVRVPQVECFISPSIGRDGHGTSPEIFQQGADWMAQSLQT